MSEIFKQHPWADVGESVRKRVGDFLRADPEYLKFWKPVIRPIVDALWKAVAYAVTMRNAFPDAYFDSKGEFLFAPADIIGHGGWIEKNTYAKDAFEMAGFSDVSNASGVREWRKHAVGRTEVVDPFSSEAFELIRNLSFQQDRLNVNGRLYVKEFQKSAKVPPFTEEDVRALVESKSVTISDFVKLKALGLVEAKIFEKFRWEVVRLLPSQLLDARFAATLQRPDERGVVREIRPGWHHIGDDEVRSLLRDGYLDVRTAEAALKNLEALDRRSKGVLWNSARTRASLDALKASMA